uniref:Glycosyltransferase n=1 Tax=viral metagenome TaxID=1070528 RepID=A0A6C0LF41_9ZZZZ
MTVINGIEIDFIEYHENTIKSAIKNNDPIENKLHVIAVISNPCLYAKRYILMKEFIHRMNIEEENVIMYIVELAYGNQKFLITEKNNPQHLQIRTECPIWHKENMINLGVKYLLPKNYKAFAWIDADIEFDSSTWAQDTLKILNGSQDIVQLFSHAIDMNPSKMAMKVFNSAGFQYIKNKKHVNSGINYSHPGYAWAITRKAYEKIGGLYENSILGSGDHIMVLSLLKNGICAINEHCTDDYKSDILRFQKNMQTLRLGYVPGVIRHYYHGSKKNRKYSERWKILVEHQFSPIKDIKRNKQGILVPTETFSDALKKDILQYFLERNEDEG